MARMVLSLDGQSLAEYNMSKERYTVGRLPDNDIRIDNAAVSGHHALIINILNDSFLEDLNSTNGTYVNGKIVKKHALQHGDSITVGHHTLRFVEGEGDEPRTNSKRPWSSARAKRRGCRYRQRRWRHMPASTATQSIRPDPPRCRGPGFKSCPASLRAGSSTRQDTHDSRQTRGPGRRHYPPVRRVHIVHVESARPRTTRC